MVEKFERLEETLIRKSNILEYYEYKMKTPEGNIVHYDMMRHKGASAVLPVTADGKILLVRQYRPAIDMITLEIPAGCRDSLEEPFIKAAARELEEETGYRAGKLTHLISLITAIAYCDERIEVYLAEDLTATKQDLDPDEYIDVEAYDLKELRSKVFSSEIIDSKTVAAIMAYAAKIQP